MKCSACKRYKPKQAFSIANKARSKTKRRGKCRVCVYKDVKRRREANPTLYKARRQAVLRKYKYGLTAEDFQRLLVQQDHKCAIGREPLTGDSLGRVSVDHDHTTGKVRGILCYGCNWGLGHFRDDVSKLQAAIAYLRKNQ